MHTGVGVGLVVAAAAVLLLGAFVLSGRAPAAAAVVLAAAGGGALAAGELLVQHGASPADWAVAVGALALLSPLHIRVVMGPFGPLKEAGLLAEDAPGA